MTPTNNIIFLGILGSFLIIIGLDVGDIFNFYLGFFTLVIGAVYSIYLMIKGKY